MRARPVSVHEYELAENVSREEYPEKWRVWEDQLLRPLLSEDPDEIRFTSYRTVEG